MRRWKFVVAVASIFVVASIAQALEVTEFRVYRLHEDRPVYALEIGLNDYRPPASILIDWGDGYSERKAYDRGSNWTYVVTHRYDVRRQTSVTVSATVTDSNGGRETISRNAIVQP